MSIVGSRGNYAIINTDTGEIVRKIKTQDVVRQQHDFLKRKEKLYKNSNKKFIWVLYDGLCEYYPDIKPQNITRLMYIVTYLSYEGYLINDNHTYMNKKSLYKKLNISRQEADRFYKDMIDNNIFVKHDNKIYVNDNCFSKGNIYKSSKYRRNITKIYVDYIRNIYTNCPVSSHKHLGYIFKIMPYVHIQYNILCKNPHEKKYSKILPLSLEDFCRIIHYSKAKKNRVLQELASRFNINGQPLLNYVEATNKTKCIFIHPNVFYAGDKPRIVCALGKFNS